MTDLMQEESASLLSKESPVAIFDLWGLLEPKQQEESRLAQDRTVALIKTESLRVVFRAMREGSTVPTHKANGAITVQVLDGHIEFTADTQTTALRKGELLALRRGVPHSLKAMKRSAILITVAVGLPTQ